MASTTSKGNYYKKKTKEWYEKLGYEVQLTEFSCATVIKGRCFYRKIDIFGADMICMNGKEIIFANSKHTSTGRVATEKSEGLRDFRKHLFPKSVRLQLVIWQPRVREPIIVDAP